MRLNRRNVVPITPFRAAACLTTRRVETDAGNQCVGGAASAPSKQSTDPHTLLPC